jgi:hypothetical protein
MVNGQWNQEDFNTELTFDLPRSVILRSMLAIKFASCWSASL